MTQNNDVFEAVIQSEVKAVVDTLAALKLDPQKAPDLDAVFEQSKLSLLNGEFLKKIEEDRIEITIKGQGLISLMLARSESACDFVASLGMGVEETTKTILDLQNHTNPDAVLERLLNHIGSQPGVLVNLFSFLIYRSITIASDLYSDLAEDSGNSTIH